jgi:hypothetical protein
VSLSATAVRHGKRELDRAISRAYTRLDGDAHAGATFSDLLVAVRARAPKLLLAPAAEGYQPGVEALLHLSRCANAHVRPIASWPGSPDSWRVVVHAMVSHVAYRYPIPPFLSAAWIADDVTDADAQRRWCLAHGAGAPFRSLPLPVRMTRRMEHIFLHSRDHFPIAYALRRAELVALGAEPPLVAAILHVPAALRLDAAQSVFWRTAWRFFIANAARLDLAQVGPIIDFLDSVRHERVAVDTGEAIVWREPPQPHFSLQGRSLTSVLRLMEGWHRSLGTMAGDLRWRASGRTPLVRVVLSEEPESLPTVWEVVELTNSRQLRQEGAALRHCVASYARACSRGDSEIWSLRRRRGDRVRSILTLEVATRTRTIVQVRGFNNGRASGWPLALVRTWAERQQLGLSL